MLALIFSILISTSRADNFSVSLQNLPGLAKTIETIAASIEKDPSKLVLMAEEHKDPIAKAIYGGVIAKVAKDTGKKVCYFLEQEKTYQPALDQLNSKNPSSLDCFEEQHKALTANYRKVFHQPAGQWLDASVMAQLKDEGVQIHAVDYPMTTADWEKEKTWRRDIKDPDPAKVKATEKELNDFTLNFRNKYMADAIKEKRKKNGCEISFFSGGRFHIFTNTTYTRGYDSIDRQFGSSTTKINAVSCAQFTCTNEPGATNIRINP